MEAVPLLYKASYQPILSLIRKTLFYKMHKKSITVKHKKPLIKGVFFMISLIYCLISL